jgi:methionyl-tRNA formyltransferase
VPLRQVIHDSSELGVFRFVDQVGLVVAIERQVRAFDPWPGTFTTLRGAVLKVLELAPAKPVDHLMVMNMGGRGDKDIFAVAEHLGTTI